MANSDSHTPIAQFVPPLAWTHPARQRALLFAPLACIALALAMVWCFGLDQRLADALYAAQDHRWVLKDAFVPKKIIHIAGRNLSVLAGLVVIACWLRALFNPALAAWRRPLGYLMASTVLSALLVTGIKRWSNMDCPWDLLRYGGSKPFVGLLQARPAGLARGVCFPAGHASSGYTWIALYFFLGVVRPRWKNIGLLVGLGAGLLFGISQQLRGAHFLSHDLFTLAICWASAAGLYCLFWPAHGTRRSVAVTATENRE